MLDTGCWILVAGQKSIAKHPSLVILSNIEYTPDDNGSIFNRYTNTGMARIDHAAPINPSDNPIANAAAKAPTSCMTIKKMKIRLIV